MYMYKEDLALNNLQQLIRHKTSPIQNKPVDGYFTKKITFIVH